MSKIYLGILTRGWVRKELFLKMLRWIKESSHSVFCELTEEKPCAHARNNLVKKFLASNNEWLLMIDDDVVPLQNPLKMINFNKDICIAPCPIYQYKVLWNIYRTDLDGYWKPIDISKEKGLIEIDSAGTGCILIKRRVLEDINAPFERIFDENGIETMGLDLSFCKKAKEKGFKIFASVDHKCSHYKTLDLIKFK